MASQSAFSLAVDSDLVIRWVADETLRSWVGRSILGAIRGPMRAKYERLFLLATDSSEPSAHEYLCPTPQQMQRYQLRIYPVPDTGLFLMTHSLLASGSPEAGTTLSSLEQYRDRQGIVVICGHCRRTRRPTEASVWDWVPAFIESLPERVSHGLCPPCAGHYFEVFEVDTD